MPVPFSLTNIISRYTPLAGDAVKRFRHQPSLFSTASRLVGQALSRLEPPVSVEPDNLALSWPAADGAAGEFDYIVLPELLIDLFVRNAVLTVVPGYQLVIEYQNGAWTEFPVNVQRLAQELDAVRPTLIESFEEALALFWSEADAQGETHWAWMADYLHDSFVHGLQGAHGSAGIPMHAIEAGMAVARWRTNEAVRTRQPTIHVAACLLQIQQGATALPFDVRLDPQLLVSVPDNEHGESHLLFSPNEQLRYFPSADGSG